MWSRYNDMHQKGCFRPPRYKVQFSRPSDHRHPSQFYLKSEIVINGKKWIDGSILFAQEDKCVKEICGSKIVGMVPLQRIYRSLLEELNTVKVNLITIRNGISDQPRDAVENITLIPKKIHYFSPI